VEPAATNQRIEEVGLRWHAPVLTSLDGYRRSWIRPDLTAGVLIVAIAIPLSMGMAEVAGVPPIAGLYSCVLPLVAYALFGSSRQLVIALDASTAAMLAAAVAPLAGGDPIRYAALAGGLTLLAGAFLLAAGAARLGAIADFLSEPVLLGYQAGLAIVVIASQLPKMLGISVATDFVPGSYAAVVGGVDDANPATLAITVGSLATVLLLRRWRPSAPGALIAVVGATLVVAALGLDEDGVAVLGPLPQGLPPIAVPDVSWADLRELVAPAAAIALLAAADTLVSSRAFAARNRYEVRANRDLVGLGAAQLTSGVSGGITVSASAARTAVAESVGSRSQVAGLTAAALMVCVLLFLTGSLQNVPQAALGAVVTAAVLRLFEPRAALRLWRVQRAEFAIAVAAMLGVALVGVLEGVVIAMALSILDFLRKTTRPHDAVLGLDPICEDWHDISRHEEAEPQPHIIVYRFDAPLFYANAERFRARVRRLAHRSKGIRAVIVDARPITDIDATALTMLRELGEELRGRGVGLIFADALGEVKDALRRDGVADALGRGSLADTIDRAVEDIALRGGPMTETLS
jgi:high affinity sulfate transporter 1